MQTYSIETAVRLSVQFTDLSGNPVDPTTVMVELTDPTNTVNTITAGIVQDDVGAYHYDWTGTISGFWFIRFQGEGQVVAASIPLQVRLI